MGPFQLKTFYSMNIFRTTFVVLLSFLCLVSVEFATAQQNYFEQQDIPYYSENTDTYRQEKCKLDIHFPTDKKEFTTIVWYHGGGLTGGQKKIPEYLKNKGYGVIAVGYRFSPDVKVEEIIADAAQSVKWVFDHIERYGGMKDRIVLSGHSAGGYLALMIGLNKRYLDDHQIDANRLMGIVPLSGQAITHFTARKEQGIDVNQPVIDEYAPLFWVRKGTAPITLITGDRELEMVGRYEENAYLMRMLKIVGNKSVKLLELEGYGHGMVYPALPLLIKEVQRWEKGL